MSINIFSSVKFRFILLYIITDKIKNVYEKLRLETWNIQTEVVLFFTLATAGTAVADWFHSAGLALLTEIGFVEILIGNFEAELTG